MTSGVKLSDAKIIKALEKNAGVITAAAESLGMDRASLSRRINKSEKLKTACEEISESMVDLAEGKLLLALRNGNMTAIIFYLKTKGKARGYIERSEFTGAGGGPVEIIVSYKKK
jgi:DNA-binding Lrp family transcriptional regulator